jgi:hypothetical protein
MDETWTDAARQRAVPVRLRWPDAARFAGPWPVVIFSHGLGGTREGGSVWGEAWAAAGFVVVHLQHPGSDLAAVRGVTNTFTDQRALRIAGRAAATAGAPARCGLCAGRDRAAPRSRTRTVGPGAADAGGHGGPFVRCPHDDGHGGAALPGVRGITEPRLAAFIAFSPTVPVMGDAQRAFDRLNRPLLSITGTRDDDVVGVGATPERRMAVFAALPTGNKAHLVLQDADHMTFAGQTGRAAEIVPREAITRDLQAAHHGRVAAISADWWRATLQDDAAAWARLAQPAGLAPGDVWQRK